METGAWWATDHGIGKEQLTHSFPSVPYKVVLVPTIQKDTSATLVHTHILSFLDFLPIGLPQSSE